MDSRTVCQTVESRWNARASEISFRTLRVRSWAKSGEDTLSKSWRVTWARARTGSVRNLARVVLAHRKVRNVLVRRARALCSDRADRGRQVWSRRRKSATWTEMAPRSPRSPSRAFPRSFPIRIRGRSRRRLRSLPQDLVHTLLSRRTVSRHNIPRRILDHIDAYWNSV